METSKSYETWQKLTLSYWHRLPDLPSGHSHNTVDHASMHVDCGPQTAELSKLTQALPSKPDSVRVHPSDTPDEPDTSG